MRIFGIVSLLFAMLLGTWFIFNLHTIPQTTDDLFVVPLVPTEIQAHIESKSDYIRALSPTPHDQITSPLSVTGEARGSWFFEASLPVTITNWNGLIIAEGFVTAEGDWMTTEFVPFRGVLTFENPYKSGDPDFMRRGTIILQKDNPSGLPQHDDALEFPIFFSAPPQPRSQVDFGNALESAREARDLLER